MIFAKLGQFVSCDTVGKIETVQAKLVLYLQSAYLSLPLQPVAPGNEVSNFPVHVRYRTASWIKYDYIL